jgi:hypothetical protein
MTKPQALELGRLPAVLLIGGIGSYSVDYSFDPDHDVADAGAGARSDLRHATGEHVWTTSVCSRAAAPSGGEFRRARW